MKDRDRLIELLREARERYIYTDEQADHLLANGVIVPPCKAGDTVYQTDGVRIYESCITEIDIFSFVTVFYTDGVAFGEEAIGKSIFLTREEAEAKLKEREKV